jgi:uncharacterized GH25 family protein
MKKNLVIIVLSLLLSGNAMTENLKPMDADDTLSKQKELETKIKLLEKEIEIEKLKKELADQKNANKEQKENTSIEISKENDTINSKKLVVPKDKNELEEQILEQVRLLGKFKEPEKYPSGFEEMFLKKGCVTWICLTKKTTIKMSKFFGRSEKYSSKFPGDQIKVMALY